MAFDREDQKYIDGRLDRLADRIEAKIDEQITSVHSSVSKQVEIAHDRIDRHKDELTMEVNEVRRMAEQAPTENEVILIAQNKAASVVKVHEDELHAVGMQKLLPVITGILGILSTIGMLAIWLWTKGSR